MNLILENVRVIRKDGTIESPKDIVIQNGFIKEVLDRQRDETKVGEGSSPKTFWAFSDADVLDCAGLYVSPGLVNLHTHSPMAIFRGIAEDVTIEDWFNAKIWPYESRLTPDDVRIGAMLGIYEMVDSGVTAFFDHYFCSEEIVKAAREAEIRADIAPTIFGAAPDWEKSLREALALIERVNGSSGLVRMRVGPHAPYTCPPNVLRECAKEAKRLGVGIHIHVSETQKQVEDSLKLFGKTPFQVLYDAGIMEVPSVFAHGIFIQPHDLSLLDDGCSFALAPKTYMKLASGLGNALSLLPRANLGIGTDGAASSNTQGPLEQARLLALLGKLSAGDARSFDLRAIWKILMKGHDALRQDTGDVAPGYAADLVVWDLAQAHTFPIYDPLASIIYSADNRNIRHVLVAGEFRKKDGRVSVFDEKSLLKDVENVKRRLLSQGAGTARVTY